MELYDDKHVSALYAHVRQELPTNIEFFDRMEANGWKTLSDHHHQCLTALLLMEHALTMPALLD